MGNASENISSPIRTSEYNNILWGLEGPRKKNKKQWQGREESIKKLAHRHVTHENESCCSGALVVVHMDYQPVIPGKHAKPAPEKHSVESRYWRSFKSPVFVKEYAPVTSVHFALSKPHRYAVTAAARVHIYAPRTQKITKTIARFKDVARSGFIRDDGKLLVAGDDSGLIQVTSLSSTSVTSTPSHMVRSSMLTPGQFSALSMLISSLYTSQSSQYWTTHRCFHALTTLLYVCGTSPHNRPLLPSPLTPTTSAPAKFPLLIHISYSPARTTALFASLILAQANVSFSWARRGDLVPALSPSSKYLCTHRGLLPCLLRALSSAYGTSSQVGDVFGQCQTTRRQLHLLPSTPTRRGY